VEKRTPACRQAGGPRAVAGAYGEYELSRPGVAGSPQAVRRGEGQPGTVAAAVTRFKLDLNGRLFPGPKGQATHATN
jgi:hypothetical protein